jgi:hypothetical protein
VVLSTLLEPEIHGCSESLLTGNVQIVTRMPNFILTLTQYSAVDLILSRLLMQLRNSHRRVLANTVPFQIVRQSRVTEPPDGAEIGWLSRVTLALAGRDMGLPRKKKKLGTPKSSSMLKFHICHASH